MTPFQEDLFRLIQDTRKAVNPFSTQDEEAAFDIQRIVEFADKWDTKQKYEKTLAELKQVQEKNEQEKKVGMAKVVKALAKEIIPMMDELMILQKFVDKGSVVDRGIQIILSNFEKFLSNKEGGIIRPQIGDELNSVKHKAVGVQEDPTHFGAPVVAEVYRVGYYVLNQVVREAEVKLTVGK